MRIKHWAGYGCVNATKVEKVTHPDYDLTKLVIKVSGNHERGLEREFDYSLVRRWLVDRFDKSANFDTYREFVYHITDRGYEDGTKFAVYELWYGSDVHYFV